MTLQIPTLLALFATALMAVAIFAPKRPAEATLSFAPPASRAEAEVERWSPSPAALPSWSIAEPPTPREPAWPSLVDERAAGCDREARLALVDALATVRAAWADSILSHALADETEASVRVAIERALDRMNAG